MTSTCFQDQMTGYRYATISCVTILRRKSKRRKCTNKSNTANNWSA